MQPSQGSRFLPAGCVHWPFDPKMAPNEARRLRDGRRWGPVAVSWGGIHSDNVWGAFYSCFARFYGFYCQRCVVSFGPKTAPHGAPMAPGPAPLGVWWPYLGTESTWATCRLPFGHVLPVFLPQMVRGLAPEQPQNGPKRPQHGSKMCPKTAEIDFVKKKTLDHLGCSTTRFRAFLNPPVWTVLTHCLAPEGLQMAHFWTEKGSKKAKPWFFKDDAGPFGVLKEAFCARFGVVFAIFRLQLAPKPPGNAPCWVEKGVAKGPKMCLSASDSGHPRMLKHMFWVGLGPKTGQRYQSNTPTCKSACPLQVGPNTKSWLGFRPNPKACSSHVRPARGYVG